MLCCVEQCNVKRRHVCEHINDDCILSQSIPSSGYLRIVGQVAYTSVLMRHKRPKLLFELANVPAGDGTILAGGGKVLGLVGIPLNGLTIGWKRCLAKILAVIGSCIDEGNCAIK